MTGDLDELRVFLTVIRAGSVKRAAEELALPRSRVRRRLEELERRAGQPLLWSDASGVHPTPAGRLVLARAPAMLEHFEALLRAARALGSED